jgi:hypothetical protein
MSDFADEATRIVERAQEKGIVMRVMGATVIRKGMLSAAPEFPERQSSLFKFSEI